MAIDNGNKKSLGVSVSLFPKEQQNKINEIIDAVNSTTKYADVITEETSGAGVTVDGVLIKDGSITHSSLASMQMGWFNVAAQQAITSNGAIATTSYYTTMNTTGGAKAYTLANASLKGQLKKIYFLTDDGNAVITGTFPGVNNTLTFANAGEYVVLIWTGTSWYPIEGSGGVYSAV